MPMDRLSAAFEGVNPSAKIGSFFYCPEVSFN